MANSPFSLPSLLTTLRKCASPLAGIMLCAAIASTQPALAQKQQNNEVQPATKAEATTAVEATAATATTIAAEASTVTATAVTTAATANATADPHPTNDDAPQTTNATERKEAEATIANSGSVYVVPIEGPINRTQLYILRRALKEAVRNNVNTVVLDMNTPGGELGVTLKMMEALQLFPGRTITYVNNEAISAGSFISMATSEIWFAPGGIMGAAEAVSGGGQDIAEGMQRKIRSYLYAKVRSLEGGSRYRADVQRAMMDPTFVLEIDGTVMKKEGELLSLTASEAAKTYGEPPEPLLSSGTAADVTGLLDQVYGAGNYTIRSYELTWSETFAKWFQTLAPILLGVGMMLLFIEFKTPGFGMMGALGIALLLLVFASNYFAGLAGYEVLIFFLLGIALLAVELLVLPGTFIAGALGVLLILGSLLWAMADIWPQGTEDFTYSPDLFVRPMLNLGIGLVIAVFGSILIAKLLPRTRIGRSLILSTSVGGTDPLLSGGGHRSIEYGQSAQQQGDSATQTDGTTSGLPAVGKRGVAVTPLRPSGQVEIDGRRYEARLQFGQLDKGVVIEVIGYRDFALLVR